MRIILFTLAAAGLILFPAATFAQDAGIELPAACKTEHRSGMAAMDNMQSMMEGMGEHQRAFTQGMMQTHDPMMKGMMADDPDVGFACAMIPHHQGAINMAEVELQHGDSDEMKQIAQKIIEDQKREIEQLTSWLEQQAP